MRDFGDFTSRTMVWLAPVLVLAQLLPATVRRCSFCRVIEVQQPGETAQRQTPIRCPGKNGAQETDWRIGPREASPPSTWQSSRKPEGPGRKPSDCPCRWDNIAVPAESSGGTGKQIAFHLPQAVSGNRPNSILWQNPRQISVDDHGIAIEAEPQYSILYCRFRL